MSAGAAYAAREYSRASELYALLLQSNPQDARASEGFARSLYALGRFDEAAAECLRILEIEDNIVFAHLILGKVAAERTHMQEAENELGTALALDPQCEEAARVLGSLALQNGAHSRAVELLSRAAQLDPASAVDRLLLGTAYQYAGRHIDSVREHSAAFRLQPSLEQALLVIYAFALAHRTTTGLFLGALVWLSILWRNPWPLALESAMIFGAGLVNFTKGSRRKALSIWLIGALFIGLYLGLEAIRRR